jgi:hypothetical protein
MFKCRLKMVKQHVLGVLSSNMLYAATPYRPLTLFFVVRRSDIDRVIICRNIDSSMAFFVNFVEDSKPDGQISIHRLARQNLIK